MQAMEVGNREIERRLDAFARARLTPDPLAAARVRARVMREARLQFEASRIAVHMNATVPVVRHRSTARRIAMPLLAASVWLGIAVGSISAAQAGGPLYASRLWIENAMVPASGAARADAELSRLESRLVEAYGASVRGDTAAVEVAVTAYQDIADAAIAASSGDPALEALVAAALDRHRAVLSAVAASLAAKGNDSATAALEASIQRAIEHNQAVIDRVEQAGAGGSGSGSTTDSKTSGGNGGGQGTGAGGATTDGGNGSGASQPEKTPRPTQEPKATSTPPDPQGPPDHSPHAQRR